MMSFMAKDITFEDISLKLPKAKKLSLEEMFYKAGKRQGEGREEGRGLINATPRRLPPIELHQTHGKTSCKRKVNAEQNKKQLRRQAASRLNQTHLNSLATELEPLHTIGYQPPAVITRRKGNNTPGMQFVNGESLPLVHRKTAANKEGQLEDETLVKRKLQNPLEFGRFGVTDTVRWAPLLFRRRVVQKCGSNRYAVTNSDEEILCLEKQMGDLLVTTRPEKYSDLFDLSGKLMESSSVYEESKSDSHVSSSKAISNYEEIFRRNRGQRKSHKDHFASAGSTQSGDESSELTPDAKRQVEERFYKALDVHVFNDYRANHQERRMAICEETEKNTFSDGVSLAWFRESLRMQDVLDNWVL